jgi:hypothetical protein
MGKQKGKILIVSKQKSSSIDKIDEVAFIQRNRGIV